MNPLSERPQKDPMQIAIEELRDDYAGIRRELDGDERARYVGIWERLDKADERLNALEEAREEAEVKEKVNRAYRVGMVAGLGLVTTLSGGTLVAVLKILQTLLAGSP